MIKFRCTFVVAVVLAAGCAPVQPTSTAPLPHTASTSESKRPSYAQRIRPAILPHIVLTEPIEGNPVAQVKVSIRPSGEVIDAQVVESSGYAHWDKSVRVAVLRAGSIPLDINGKVPPVLYISFRPKP